MRLVENLAVGVELEFEGISAGTSTNRLTAHGMMDWWETHTDGSLRPPDRNTEFVFRRPLVGPQIEAAITGLAPIIESKAYQLSWRCGMHVHIDHRAATRGDVIKEVTLGCLLDRVWYGWDNTGRHESKFCVPLSHVWEDMVRGPRRQATAESMLRGYKYTGMNVSRVYAPDIGTIEYRYASGSRDPDRIMEFIGLAMWASTARTHFTTGIEIIESFVAEGTYENWLAKYMPADTHEAWSRGMDRMLGPHYPSALELEAACGFAERMGADSELELFAPAFRQRDVQPVWPPRGVRLGDVIRAELEEDADVDEDEEMEEGDGEDEVLPQDAAEIARIVAEMRADMAEREERVELDIDWEAAPINARVRNVVQQPEENE